MRWRALIVVVLLLPVAVAAQLPAVREAPSREAPDAVLLAYERFADHFGSWLVAAFDAIPAARYDYRPTPTQQTVGYIAQHLEDANYSLCERLGGLTHPSTGKDSLADTVKARWPKDTLVTRLKASLQFCDTALERAAKPQAALTSTLLAFETDLAEHYSQIAIYMRLLDMVPPSARPPKRHTAVELPASTLSAYVGVYQLAAGTEFDVTLRDAALFVRSTAGGAAVQLWPESRSDFFVKEADAQVTFARDTSGTVTGLVLHQYGRDRPAKKLR